MPPITQFMNAPALGGSIGFFTNGTASFSAVGKGSPLPIVAGVDSISHGSGNVVDATCDTVSVFGRTNLVYGVYRGLVAGRNNTIGISGGVYGQFLSEVFCVGRGNSLGTAGTGSYRCAAIGRDNTNSGYSDCFIFGRSNTITSDPRRSTIFGRSNIIAAPGAVNGTNNFVFGYGNTVYSENVIVGGLGNYVYGSGRVFGTYNTFNGGESFICGYNNTVYGAHGAVFGNANYVTRPGPGPDSVFFSCGYGNYSNGYQTFAFGRFASVTRNNQRTWSADRAFTLATPGAAQVSDMARWLESADATQTAIITLDLDLDKTYSIRAYVTGRNTDTPAESATFELPKSALASRDAGVALLQNGPLSLSTTTNTGGGSTAWSVDLAAVGNDILLRVTGDALDAVEWIARFEFDEVLG